MTKKLLIPVVLVLVVAASFVMLWVQSRPAPEVYELVYPQIRDVRNTSLATGVLEARKILEYKPKVTGQVNRIYVKAGQKVKAGDKLVSVSVISDAVALSNAESNVKQAAIEYGEAKKEAERAARLYDKGAISKQEYERASARLDVASEVLDNASGVVEAITTGASGRISSDNNIIRATAAGTVLSVPVTEGETVLGTSSFSPGNTVAVVAGMDDFIFRGKVDETQVAGIAPGLDMSIVPAAFPEISIPAVVEYVAQSSVVENGVKMFELKAKTTIPNGFDVRSGYSANAVIVRQEALSVVAVDEVAVSFQEDGTFVYRLVSPVGNSNVQNWEKVPVETGVSDGITIEIKQGVSTDDILRGLKK